MRRTACGGVRRTPAWFWRAWLIVALGLAGAVRVRAEGTWADRIAAMLGRVEATVSELDGKRADEKLALKARIQALDERVGDLEAERGRMREGVDLSGDGEQLSKLTMAVIKIESRVGALRNSAKPVPRPAAPPVAPPKSSLPGTAEPKSATPGFTFSQVARFVFDKERPQAWRVAAWEQMKGQRFDDVGVGGVGMHVDSRIGITAILKKKSPEGRVRVESTLEDYKWDTKEIMLVGTTLSAPDAERPPPVEAPDPMQPGTTPYEALGDFGLLSDHDLAVGTRLEISEKLIGVIGIGDRFEIRKCEGEGMPWFFIVSHMAGHAYGWTPARLVKARAVE